MGAKIGLINCSGACYPAILGKSACNKAATGRSEKIAEVCFTEHATSLLSCQRERIKESERKLAEFSGFISISGCGASCATKLLQLFGITPREIHIAEDLNVESKTPPFTMEEIQRLKNHLDEAVSLIYEYAEDLSRSEASPELIMGTSANGE